MPLAALSPSIRVRTEVAQERLAALLVSGQDQLPIHAACHEHVVVEGPSVGAVEGNGKVGVELAHARLDQHWLAGIGRVDGVAGLLGPLSIVSRGVEPLAHTHRVAGVGRHDAIDVASLGDGLCRDVCHEGVLGEQGSSVLVGEGGEPRRKVAGRDVPVVHAQVPHGTHGAIGRDLFSDRREVGGLLWLSGLGGRLG